MSRSFVADSPDKALQIKSTPTAWKVAVGVALVSLTTYIATLAPTVVGGDSGELITAAVTLGIPHPPGYPLYCLLGRLFITLVPFGSPAYRVNFFSAVAAAATAGLLTYLIAIAGTQLTSSRRPFITMIVAGVSGLLWAWSRNFWSQATSAEVYPLHAFFVAAYLIFLFRWAARAEEKWLYRSALLIGLSMTNHHLTLLFLPTLFFQWLITVREQPTPIRLRTTLKTLGLFCLPLTLYLYLPIRAFMDTPYDWAKATNLQAFFDHVTRRQYHGFKLMSNFSAFVDSKRFWNFELYQTYAKHLTENYSWLWLAALIGSVPLRKRPRFAIPLAFIWFMGSLFIWINISQGDFPHYLFDTFMMPGEFALMVCVGIGLLWLLDRCGKSRWGTLAMGMAICSIPLGVVSANWNRADRHNDYIVYDIYSHVLNSFPKDAVYFTYGDTNTSAMLYLKLVEKMRPDVAIFDYLGGQNFKNTPPNWIISGNREKSAASLKLMVKFIRETQKPVYIAYGHPLLGELTSDIVPYGPIASYDPKKAKQKNFRSDFPWNRLKIRGLDDPLILFSDNWNWIAVGDILLGRIFEQYGTAEISAVDNFAKILLLTPQSWLNDGGLSLLYASQGHLEEALREQYRVVLAHPDEATSYYNLGLLYAAAGSKENTSILWKYAQHLDPKLTASFPKAVQTLRGTNSSKPLG